MIRAILKFLRIPGFRDNAPQVAVIRLAGVIGQASPPMRPGLTLAGLVTILERAFTLKNLKAVALQVNSPGGAPAQSSLIQQRIRALSAEKNIPVFAFAEDVAASGGYWLACAGDEIYADKTSIIGSLGVISAGFGFPQFIERFGIERRVHTAGERKGMLDPFLPENPDDVERLLSLQGDVHDTFKEMVRDRRAGKLKGSEDELFSGEFWTGSRALELGLIDGIGELTTVMQERYGKEVKFRPVADRRGWLRQRLGVMYGPSPSIDAVSGNWADQLITAVEQRLIWNRFGL